MTSDRGVQWVQEVEMELTPIPDFARPDLGDQGYCPGNPDPYRFYMTPDLVEWFGSFVHTKLALRQEFET